MAIESLMYDFKIIYRPGSQIGNADAMSRILIDYGENLEMESNGSQVAEVSVAVNGSDVTGDLLLEPVDLQEKQEKEERIKIVKIWLN